MGLSLLVLGLSQHAASELVSAVFLVGNLVSVKLFTSDPTKPLSSAAVWSSAAQTIGKQDEVLKMAMLELHSRVDMP